MTISCRHCGFDPLVYVKDRELAAQKVKAFLEKRKEDPAMLLRPALNLPKITAEQATELRKQEIDSKRTTGKILSRQI
jgi:metallophosphoesterase superfamily enzyme